MPQYLHTILSYIVFISIAILMSTNKKAIKKTDLVIGIICQFFFAIIVIKIPSVVNALTCVNDTLKSISDSAIKGTSVVFGGLAKTEASGQLGFIMALQSLPVLIVLSALSSVLIYIKVLPFFINILSNIFQKTLRIGGTLGVAISTNIFAGLAETPLIITPYLKRLTKNELFTLITCGMAGLASSVMVLIDIIIRPIIPNAMVHTLSSVLIGIPMVVTISKIIIPESSNNLTGANDMELKEGDTLIESVFTGIMNGAKVLVTIVAMLIGFISLIDIANKILDYLPYINNKPISIQMILGFLMAPISWIIGVESSDIINASSIIGTKIVFNEILATQEFLTLGSSISHKTQIIVMYVISGFANFGSVGLAIGVYSMLVPERRDEVLKIGMKSLVAGNLVNFINASLVALFI
ncbi:NupC/NupG family nucleoside CNT transporter [Lyticum sinuosum]|uniref:Nucleoside:proton symporter n=1 Tax=Lyticum sinuosum TaxID=1332059 RepID=A0AAE4VM97_9RICK|nr:nucleoside transporter C-terminal domain-containing protein [Lyticum sinuosum]MDZ5761398.1 Nucleoside:proton symporter [Lyticum sinuosum]